jgi:hypothetical protein
MMCPELIKRIRHKAVAKICNIIGHWFNVLVQPEQERTEHFCLSRERKWDSNEVSNEVCEYIQLGCLVRGLCANGLLPFPVAEEYAGAVDSLAKAISAINSPFGMIPWSRSDEHPHFPLRE